MTELKTIEQLRSILERNPAVVAVAAQLELEGLRGWLVGGAVRDLLLDLEPREIDVVVEADAIALAKALSGGRDDAALRTHERFGTASLLVEGAPVDLASARSETYTRPGALPDVAPGLLDEDLRRRDFTVNAIAIDLVGPLRGAIHDPLHGLVDLAGSTLRVLHDRSFVDDPTRLWRLARYRARLGFAIDPGTDALARQALADGALDTVAPQRNGSELVKLLGDGDPPEGLRAAVDLGLLRAIGAPGADPDAARAALGILPEPSAAPGIGMVACWLGADGAAGIARAMGVGLAWADHAGEGSRLRELEASLAGATSPHEIAAAARSWTAEAVAVAGARGPRDAAVAWLDRIRAVEIPIGGDDLIAAGVAEGPLIRQALEVVRAACMDGACSGRDQALALALESVRQAEEGR